MDVLWLKLSSLRRRAAVSALVIALATCAVACGGDDSNSNADPTPIRGGERLAWNQAASSVQSLRSLTFKLYVDGTVSDFADTRCSEVSSGGGYECSGRVPGMSSGRHVLELTSVLNGVESPRSGPLTVQFTPGQTTTPPAPRANPAPAGKATATASCAPTRGECYSVRVLAADLKDPTDLTPTPDGRLFFVEGGKYVRVIDDGILLPDAALALSSDTSSRIVGLAADTAFDRTHTFFVAWAEATFTGATHLNITRYREVNNSFGEGAQIVTGLEIPADAAVPLSVDAGGLLYVALPGGLESRSAPEQTPFGGAVLRFDRDGLTPRANPTGSPIVSNGYTQPTALAIDVVTGRVWLGGTPAARPSIASFIIPRDIESAPIQPTLVDTSALERSQPQMPGPALAFDRTNASAALAVDSKLYKADRTPSGQLALLERLSPDQGVPLAVASAFDGTWYLAVRSDWGVGRVLALQPKY
jgi:hypothetical protein